MGVWLTARNGAGRISSIDNRAYGVCCMRGISPCVDQEGVPELAGEEDRRKRGLVVALRVATGMDNGAYSVRGQGEVVAL